MTCAATQTNPLGRPSFTGSTTSDTDSHDTFPHDEDDQDSGVFHDDSARYVVTAELGAGLQGQVDLAFDKLEQRYVAVKLPTFELREGTKDVDLRHLDCQVQSIIQERDAMRLVHHPNVLHFIRSMPGRKSHHAYVMLVMEYASQGDLFDLISQTGALSETTSKHYFHQLLLGVQACHAAGVIHRDVKPENILFDDQFNLKLCDFGLASIVPADQVLDAELCDVEGTQLYMAPEIEGVTSFHGPPVDAWACGVVLFILLTGFPPYESAEAGDLSYDCVLAGDMAKFWATQPESLIRPTQDAMDLVNGLLCVDPDARSTVQQALSHPWLQDVNAIDVDAVLEEMTERRRHCTELLFEEEA